MMSRLLAINPFLVAAVLALLSAGYIFYDSFLNQNFAVFTDEVQIEEAILSEFSLFADYLL